jgi:hypothetical protein
MSSNSQFNFPPGSEPSSHATQGYPAPYHPSQNRGRGGLPGISAGNRDGGQHYMVGAFQVHVSSYKVNLRS